MLQQANERRGAREKVGGATSARAAVGARGLTSRSLVPRLRLNGKPANARPSKLFRLVRGKHLTGRSTNRSTRGGHRARVVDAHRRASEAIPAVGRRDGIAQIGAPQLIRVPIAQILTAAETDEPRAEHGAAEESEAERWAHGGDLGPNPAVEA